MKEKIRATRYVCDGCGVEQVVGNQDTPPNGYHGTVALITELGGSGSVDWYADTKACIEDAVDGALDRAAG